MRLYLKPFNDNVKAMYKNHTHYKVGDSGLDLFFSEDLVIEPKTTLFVDLKIINRKCCC